MSLLQRMALEFIHERSETRPQEEWSELKRKLYSTDFLVPGPILKALQSESYCGLANRRSG